MIVNTMNSKRLLKMVLLEFIGLSGSLKFWVNRVIRTTFRISSGYFVHRTEGIPGAPEDPVSPKDYRGC